MLNAARQRVPEGANHNVALLLGDAQVLGFESAVFDVVTSRMGSVMPSDTNGPGD
jgi:ubiquinone/menaquinone biosynthesis C-methylase UbiE